jgi:CheY-like chemotaxis protein
MAQEQILVVDDDLNIQVLVKTILSQKDYRVITASNGEEALEVLKKEKFQAIIVDAMMPVMDGNTLARKIKESAATRDIPIIMITASKEVDMVKKSFSAGCVLFLPKPFTASSLLSLIQLILNKKID